MKMNENEDGGFEVEASPTFFGSSGGLVEEDEDDIEQLPQQDDESTMNDESTIAASSYISRGYSYVASNTKWVFVVMAATFVVMAATFVVFFSIGVGLGYGPIGNIIYGNDDASSVSSAMAVDYTTSDGSAGNPKSDKSGGLSGAKSGKSSGSKSSKVAQLYINENLDTGDAVTVYEAGPIKIEAGCGNRDNSICNDIIFDDSDDGGVKSEACLILTLFDANEDLLVFGDADEDSGLENPPIGDTSFQVLDAGVTYKTELWDVSKSGNDIDEGGVWANNFYVGYDGESFIGVRNDTELGVIGGNCQIAGVFNYVIP